MDEIKILNRFTSLPILLDILERQKLVLIDPIDSWEDRNDTLVIAAYKKEANVKDLFALCFTYKAETIHHWKSFANGSNGCCIEFDAPNLFEILNSYPNLVHGVIMYKKIKDTIPGTFQTKDILFIKRHPYKPENEYRLIWVGQSEKKFFEIDIPISVIKKITFSQLMPDQVFKSIESLLVRVYPHLKNRINRSTVYENKTWIKKFSLS